MSVSFSSSLLSKPLIALALLASFVSTQALAAGSIAEGKAKAAACGACHGQAGISSNPMWPNLAGQKDAYLAKQMRDFKSGARKDPVMAGMAMILNDQDIENLAAYYSSLK
jgi:cytochrome c553